MVTICDVKGINFQDLKDAGDPIELAKKYVEEGADELVFLDISATIENRKTLLDLVSKISEQINIPFTVGGGVKSVADVRDLIQAGADKVSVNSAAVSRPALIREIANEFGSQCVVLAIDTKFEADEWYVYVHGGRTRTTLKTIDWAIEAEKLGAGELLLTSMNNDGTKGGFDLAITHHVSVNVTIPIIASGGAGTKEHFKTVFEQTEATGGLAASIFHYGEVSIQELKKYLNHEQIPVR